VIKLPEIARILVAATQGDLGVIAANYFTLTRIQRKMDARSVNATNLDPRVAMRLQVTATASLDSEAQIVQTAVTNMQRVINANTAPVATLGMHSIKNARNVTAAKWERVAVTL